MPALKMKTARAEVRGLAVAEEAKVDFVPLDSLQNALRFWWIVFLLALVGGLLGYMVHSTRPPVYEAVGRFSANIDFVSTGPMTQFEEDIALNAVGTLVYDNVLMEEVVARAGEQGITTSVAELREATSLERKVNDWELRLRLPEPLRAEQLANIWLEQGHNELLETHQHALRAEQHRRTLRALENCLQQSAASEPVSVLCSPANFTEIQINMQSVGEQYSQELIASRSISPALRIGPAGRAQVSSRPVIFGRAQLVLAGAFIGFLVGILLVQLRFPASRMKRS